MITLLFLSARPVRAATGISRRTSASSWSFYPRGPCGPRRLAERFDAVATVFLSARPVRAATSDDITNIHASCSFYPRGPCGPRRGLSVICAQPLMFLSARPVRAATHARSARLGGCWSFYPRGPCGPRRRPLRDNPRAPRCFYPRGPCGPRPTVAAARSRWLTPFLSARPVRAATPSITSWQSKQAFLSARPVRAATRRRGVRHQPGLCFYPRGPCGPRRLPPGW